MDELTKFLVRELIDGQSVTAIYGGGFKPPTKGHFDLVKTALKDFKDIETTIIYTNPTFKVWVGNYKLRIHAEKALIDIKKKYPTALLIKPNK